MEERGREGMKTGGEKKFGPEAKILATTLNSSPRHVSMHE